MRHEREPSVEEWVQSLPARMRADPLWESAYYRWAMFLYDMAWEDAALLRRDFRGREVASQMIRSAGSICANVEEAYGRGVGTQDYIRILRIALGEARETQGWYYRSRHLLDADLVERRLRVIDQIIALLVNIIAHQRRNLQG